jgi:hypothetical protein
MVAAAIIKSEYKLPLQLGCQMYRQKQQQKSSPWDVILLNLNHYLKFTYLSTTLTKNCGEEFNKKSKRSVWIKLNYVTYSYTFCKQPAYYLRPLCNTPPPTFRRRSFTVLWDYVIAWVGYWLTETLMKPLPGPLRPLQILSGLPWARNRASAMRSQQQPTARDLARPSRRFTTNFLGTWWPIQQRTRQNTTYPIKNCHIFPYFPRLGCHRLCKFHCRHASANRLSSTCQYLL